MFLEDFQRDQFESAFVGRGQHHGCRYAGMVGLQPVGRRHTPTVPRRQSGEPVLGHRSAEVIADASLVLEELPGDHGTHRVAAQVLGPGMARAVAIEAGQRVTTTGLELAPEHIPVCHSLEYRLLADNNANEHLENHPRDTRTMASHRVGPFQVEGAKDTIRTVLGAATLIGLGEPVLTGLAKWRSPRTLHRAIRLWAGATRRFLGLEMSSSGVDNIDHQETYVVAPLHEGFADALLLASLPLRLRYLVRDELLEWRYLGRFLRASGQLEIATQPDRRDLRGLLKHCREIVEGGESLVVFPQGSILGVEVAFTRGAFVLADRLIRPVLPVVITGTHRVWEHPYSPTLRYHQKVNMEVLPPIAAGEGIASMREVEREMKTIALANTNAPVRRFDPDRDGYWDGYSYEIDPRFPELAAQIKAHRSTGRLA